MLSLKYHPVISVLACDSPPPFVNCQRTVFVEYLVPKLSTGFRMCADFTQAPVAVWIAGSLKDVPTSASMKSQRHNFYSGRTGWISSHIHINKVMLSYTGNNFAGSVYLYFS